MASVPDPRTRVQIASVFHPGTIGGVATHATTLHDRMAAEGVDVARADYTPIASAKGPLRRAAATLRFGARVARLLLRGYRTVHIHASNRASVFYAFAPVLQALGADIILSLHSGRGFNDYLAHEPAQAAKFERAARRASAIVFMNEAEAAAVGARFPQYRDRIRCIPPYIAPAPGASGALPRRPSSPFTVACVGLWHPRYCVEEALGACARLAARKGVPVAWHLAMGTSLMVGDYRERVLALADAHPEVASVIREDHENVPALLAGSHLLIRPSREDSYGLVIAEALAVGTPAIATDICTRAAGSMLYRPGDLDALDALVDEVYAAPPDDHRSRLAPGEDAYYAYRELYAEFARNFTKP